MSGRLKAHDALDVVGGDDAPALEEERRTVLLEIEEGAVSYMTLHAGVAAAEGLASLSREAPQFDDVRRHAGRIRLRLLADMARSGQVV